MWGQQFKAVSVDVGAADKPNYFSFIHTSNLIGVEISNMFCSKNVRPNEVVSLFPQLFSSEEEESFHSLAKAEAPCSSYRMETPVVMCLLVSPGHSPAQYSNANYEK